MAICKDLDFPAISRDYGRSGATLLAVPSWDFTVDGQSHARMAITRGVESGTSVIRAARSGWLSISDPSGAVLAAAPSPAVGTQIVTATVPSRPAPTLYDAIGDAFVLFCSGLVAAGLLCLTRYEGDLPVSLIRRMPVRAHERK